MNLTTKSGLSKIYSIFQNLSKKLGYISSVNQKWGCFCFCFCFCFVGLFLDSFNGFGLSLVSNFEFLADLSLIMWGIGLLLKGLGQFNLCPSM